MGFIRCGLLAGALVIPLAAGAGWQLTWSDEFTQADGTSPNSTKWGYDIGGGGYGNNELESYTSRTNNARIQNNQLVIEARQENYTGPDNIPRNYTSARLLTKGKWAWTYGRMEARIKIPRGQGIWPAFWMLGANISSVNWPTCGEIDILENIGKVGEQGKVYGTIHGPQSGGDYNGGAGVGSNYTLPGGAVFADDFHVFAIEWTTNQIKWFMDSQQYFTATPASLPGGSTWVFTQPQFLLLNVAVGGNWPGNPDGTTVFPQQMIVDYVRVYNFVATVPSAPTNLTASVGNAKVYLRWDDPSSGATGYNLKRATNSGGPYVNVGNTAANSFTDTGAANCATYYYVVTATNSLGESTPSSEATAALGAFAVAVNSGGSAAGLFAADANVTGGTIGATVSTTINLSGVIAPAPQAVYQAERYGNFTYTFTGLTPGMNYKVRLHSAETYWTAVGQRRFNVVINGAQVLTNFDIIAVAGAPNKATVQEFNVTAASGQIVIQYVTVTDNARASGIEILQARTAAPSATNNGPLWTGMTLNLGASTVAGATYNWSGPNGFVSTNRNPSVTNVSTNISGTYNVTATVGGCVSVPATTTVLVIPPATVAIQPIGNSVILDWTVGTLQVATNVGGPWNDLDGVAPPRTNPATAPQEFFRLKRD